MKQITKDLRIIRMRRTIAKVREEYHSFMRVRELKDINLSCSLMITMLRLENNLVDAVNNLEKEVKRK